MGLRHLPARLVQIVRAWRARRTRPRHHWHSVSSCSEYQLCPRRYRFGYVDRVPPLRRVPLTWRYGSVVHRGLEAAYRSMLEGTPPTESLEQARAAVEHAWIDEEMPDDPEWLADALEAATGALDHGLAGGGEILGVEHGFRHVFPDGLRFTGFTDLVLRRPDGAVEIIDHKVTRSLRTVAELGGDTQLNMYGWFASQTWPGARMIRASHHYPLVRATVTTTLSPDRMEETAGRLVDIARQAEADREMVPKPGEHCGHCPWLELCDAGRLIRTSSAPDAVTTRP